MWSWPVIKAMTRIDRLTLHADRTGTLELVCRRADADGTPPKIRSFEGRDQFGLLVDGLAPGERVTLFFERGDDPDDGRPG